jgi:hypothetical protein
MATLSHSTVKLSQILAHDGFSVRLKRRFSVPACSWAPRRAQRWSRLAEGHREAARRGLDRREHGARLDPVGTDSRPTSVATCGYATVSVAGLPPRPLFFLTIGRKSKHGSWLNLAESELGVLSSQCLDRRIADKHTLSEEIAAWEEDRNANHAKADWHFTTDNARIKLKHLYPAI